MEYNTARPKLVIPEYGRTVQKIAEHIMTLPDREDRNRAANTLINIMAQVNPLPKDQADAKQKIWDHLFILTNFKLDVDSPYEKPSPEIAHLGRPQPIPYQDNRIRYKHYGKNVERMLAYATTLQDGPEKDAFVNSLASYMKMAYWMWNNDKAPDVVVIDSISEMTNGKIHVQEINEFAAHNESYAFKKKDPKKQNQNFKNKNQNFKNKNQNRPFQRNNNNNRPGNK